ncbi:MAG: 3-oxoacyl-[acyl-carrier protein] reductase [Ignavibacteriae bacterium]|nr:MAG: 3-oxoacyl-[acyl-carrier protein] reductase [Ignavibacteriota bacterium]
MDLGIKNKTAIVSAASKGLGKATAQALANEGASVVIFSRNKQEIEKAAEEISRNSNSNVLPISADVTRLDDIKNVVDLTIQKFGGIDILINNTGGPPVGSFEDITDEQWLYSFNLILLSMIRMTRLVLPYMMKKNWGRIVNITSLTAKQPVNDLITSSTLRPGILGLTKILSNQYSKYGILFNNVCPGFILTQRSEEISRKRAGELQLSFEEYLKQQSRDIPLGRYGQVQELADFITFLCSEKASYITGATFSVDGGLIKGLF